MRSHAVTGLCISNLSDELTHTERPSRNAETMGLMRHCRATQLNGDLRGSMSTSKSPDMTQQQSGGWPGPD
jgi:hypothetical protein